MSLLTIFIIFTTEGTNITLSDLAGTSGPHSIFDYETTIVQ